MHLQLYLTSVLVGGNCLTSRPGRLSPGKELKYPLDEVFFGPQSRCERFGEEKNRLSLEGFEPPTVQHLHYLQPPTTKWMRKEVKTRQNNELIHTECGKWKLTSSVDTVTRVRDGRSGARIPVQGQYFVFTEPSRTLWGPIQPHIQCGPALLSRE